MSKEFFHSVRLEESACLGCTNCIKHCPTEAIRVRGGKAIITAERCIDCGECIRVCPHHAKKPVFDTMALLENYEYCIALPAPALYAQFNNVTALEIIGDALKKIGFHHVYEVAKAAEIVSHATREYLQRPEVSYPVLSSACPAIVRLIRIAFPSLIDKVLPLRAPVELAARLAIEQAIKRTGLPERKIGAFFISPCPAKVTAAKMPLGTNKSAISGVLAISDLYPRLLSVMTAQTACSAFPQTGQMGISWGCSCGEAEALYRENYLAVDGIDNVMQVLEDLEDQKFPQLDFIELNACHAGCVGGVLNVENPYIARTKLQKLKKNLPHSRYENDDGVAKHMGWDCGLEFMPILELDSDISVAMAKLHKMDEFLKTLPGLDCGSCGAPSCRAFAEDVVCGVASINQCIFKFRENILTLVQDFSGEVPSHT